MITNYTNCGSNINPFLNESKDKIELIYKHFGEKIGLDPETLAINKDFAITYKKLEDNGYFYPPGHPELINYLNKNAFSDEEKVKISMSGLIVINSKYLNEGYEAELLVSLLHEFIHANRLVLTDKSHEKNIPKTFDIYNDKRFIKEGYHFIDYADICWSKEALSNQELRKAKNYQYNINESLTELMSISAYRSYYKGEEIMETVKKLERIHEDECVKAMARIIIRHQDLILFKWMIDPLLYQKNDLKYDFFNEYINANDIEDINILYNNLEDDNIITKQL